MQYLYFKFIVFISIKLYALFMHLIDLYKTRGKKRLKFWSGKKNINFFLFIYFCSLEEKVNLNLTKKIINKETIHWVGPTTKIKNMTKFKLGWADNKN